MDYFMRHIILLLLLYVVDGSLIDLYVQFDFVCPVGHINQSDALFVVVKHCGILIINQ